MSQLPERLEGDCAVIAFYGFDHEPPKIETFFDRMVAWFESLGVGPTKLSSTTCGKIGKLGDFSRKAKRLRQTGFDEVTSFEIYSPTPWHDATCTDFYLAAGYQGGRADHHVFVAADTRVASLNDSRMEVLGREMVAMLHPAYGVGYIRAKNLGPTFYVSGIGMNPPGYVPKGQEYEKCLTICRWGDIAMPKQVYRQGIIRDVYPLNFLGKAHLSQQVGSMTLDQWIREDPRRGRLEPVSDEMWLWSVGSDEIVAIQSVLSAAGLIFDWRKYIEQPAPPAEQDSEKGGTARGQGNWGALESLGTTAGLGFISPEQYAVLLLEIGASNVESIDTAGIERVAASVPAGARSTLMEGITQVLSPNYQMREVHYRGPEPANDVKARESDLRMQRVRAFASALQLVLQRD